MPDLDSIFSNNAQYMSSRLAFKRITSTGRNRPGNINVRNRRRWIVSLFNLIKQRVRLRIDLKFILEKV